MRQQFLAVLVLMGVTGVVLAGTVEQGLADCAGIDAEQQRLVCFDTLARDVATGPKPVTSEPPEEPSTETFGLEHKDPNLGGDSELRAIVTGINKTTLGKMMLTLDNGQVWQQKDSKTLLLREGDAVLIERGALSAFYLSADGNKRIAVARVK